MSGEQARHLAQITDEARRQADSLDYIAANAVGMSEVQRQSVGAGANYIRALLAVGVGWCLPEEATPEMKLAGGRSIGNSMHRPNHTERAELCWRDMVASFRTGALPQVPDPGLGEMKMPLTGTTDLYATVRDHFAAEPKASA